MKLFIKSLFVLFYIVCIGVTLVYASNEGFLTNAGKILIFILFGVSINIIIKWFIKEE